MRLVECVPNFSEGRRPEIVAKILAIANGARIEGEVTVTSGKAIVKFDEKRERGAA